MEGKGEDMKTILVPIDFSGHSINAFKLAVYMAKVKGIAIKLLYIAEESPFKALFNSEKHSEYMNEMEVETKQHLERIVSLENTEGVNVEYEVRKSKVGIAREILKEKCDLIIMGRKREDNEEVLFYGSIADKIVRLSAIPVITVGELPEQFAFKKFVFAADFEEEELKPIVTRVLDLARIFSAELFFLYVMVNREYLDDDQASEKISEITSQYDLQGHPVEVYYAPTPEEGMSYYINDANPDLLVMCTHGKTGIVHFFKGSTAENMADYSEVPVLTYNINPKYIDRSTKPITREKIVWTKKSDKKVKK